MPQFRRKPKVIKAEQFFYDVRPWPEEVEILPYSAEDGSLTGGPAVRTSRGNVYLKDGDWIVTGIRGCVYPVQEDIFEELYERVKEEA